MLRISEDNSSVGMKNMDDGLNWNVVFHFHSGSHFVAPGHVSARAQVGPAISLNPEVKRLSQSQVT